MRKENKSTRTRKKKIKHQLYQLLDESTLSMDFVSAFAGDREPSYEENTLFKKLKKRRGNNLYSDILFVITHKYYPSRTAKELWDNILRHKYELSQKLGRNIGIAASALDYLSNIQDELEKPTLISEPKLSTIAEVAVKDALTPLYDRSTFFSKLETEVMRYERYGSECSVIMVDVDDFKKFNDTYGHREGDNILISIASIMLQVTRGLDICARYGGEEFAVILPQTGSSKASALAERLRKRTARDLKKMEITISIGVATCPRDAKSAKPLVEKADKALYRSKHKGKNRVTVY